MIIVRQGISYLYPRLTVGPAALKESLTSACIIGLFFIIRRGERLPLSSVGIGVARWSKSLGRGVLLTLALVVIGTLADVIAVLSHYQENEFAREFNRLPLWLVTVTCIRAGVGEELFYRGYAIERLQALGVSRFWAAAIPVLIFSLAHWTSDWPNIITAFVIGSVLSMFYVWRRDLVAIMIGHFLVDCISVVVPRLFS